MYPTAIKNKDKKEFNWETNQSCIDFHLIINKRPNYYYSGSYCDGIFEYYSGMNGEEELDEYFIDDFEEVAENAVKRFLNRKNKKQYQIDEPLEIIPIKLWNATSEDYDNLKLHLNLTYCP